MPLAWAREHLQEKLGRCVQGNLDPQLLVVGGAPLLAGAQRILEALGAGPLVFNLGHGVSKVTPPAHVEALARYVHDWRPAPNRS